MTKQIALSQGYKTAVDDNAYSWLSQWKWHYRQGYASRVVRESGRYITINMHRLIMDAQPGDSIDHINGDKLDNRRLNLRVCSNQQNQFNRKKPITGISSKYKGVHLSGDGTRWAASVKHNQSAVHLGLYDREEDAARAYDAAALFLFGDFAKPNFADSVQLSPKEVRKRAGKARSGTSRYTGVARSPSGRKWRAYINIDGKRKWIGSFDTENEAAKARDAVALEMLGDGAVLNL